ncbi:hypothetical protein IAQ61_007260 [Plenodomus lingam]|uniref:uncharacterized protein n=1 Tax=Leptosphaeria maculans TaxID=5022 RepID=UPI003317AE54|nr:hypothetical protein IAQ61_007260 [Plenodomus lingam]
MDLNKRAGVAHTRIPNEKKKKKRKRKKKKKKKKKKRLHHVRSGDSRRNGRLKTHRGTKELFAHL